MAFNYPSGLILLFDSACPSGWTDLSSTYSGKFIKLTTVVGSAGDTGGNSQHRHTVDPPSQDSGNATPVYNYYNCTIGGAGSSNQNWGGHQHPVNPGSVYTDYETNLPPYLDMLLCKKD